MAYNLAEAGHAIGRNKSTVLRAIRRGTISATRDPANGSWLIEPAELHRVFPPRQATSETRVTFGEETSKTAVQPVAESKNALPRNRDDSAELRELRARLELAELRLTDTQDHVTDLRRRLDEAHAERRQTADRLAAAQERIAALLTDQRTAPSTPAATPRRSWLPWRRQS
jgi:hypothetical protein